MDSSLVSQEAKKRSSRKQVMRNWSRQDTVIFQDFGMNRRQWRELPSHERKAFRLAWMAQQEETDTIKPTRTPGYVYVLRHPRYADLARWARRSNRLFVFASITVPVPIKSIATITCVASTIRVR